MPEENSISEVDKPTQQTQETETLRPAQAYDYPHSTDHPPVSPIPDEGEHHVKSYGGAPEGGT